MNTNLLNDLNWLINNTNSEHAQRVLILDVEGDAVSVRGLSNLSPMAKKRFEAAARNIFDRHLMQAPPSEPTLMDAQQ